MHPVSHFRTLAVLLIAWSSPLPHAFAADRVVVAVDPARRVTLPGGRPAWANPQTDAGALPAGFPIQHATILLSRSPEFERAFEQLLDRQQQPGSPDYHRWRTPIEVGERFGASTNDIAAVTGWLVSANLEVESVSNSRVLITFSGSAAAVSQAFGAPMHRYNVGGEERISIASDPSIPAALGPVIRAVAGLYTVKLQPMHGAGAANLPALSPVPSPEATFSGTHYVFPADFATIYDLNPVYANGIDGTGQTIAIIGRSRVDNTDIEYFQQLSGLPVRDPTVIVPPNGVDPGAPVTTQGSYSGDQLEATIDVTRAASVAPGATIDLVVSGSNSTHSGLYLATQYVVDSSPVPAHVMNISFGACENSDGAAGVALWDTLFSQAAAEGISVFVCSGDAGAAGCDQYNHTPPASQIHSPNYICSSSYATCVGGTEFADAGTPSQYWSASSTRTPYESALGYIPEGAWNEPTASNGSTQASASGGGVSAYIATPAWQSGVAPGYQGRYTPDVSFTASGHDGYFACLAAAGNGCPGGTVQRFEYVYGTSASAPDMAGVAALLNQHAGSPQGNLNPALYRLSVTAPNAFHDVTVQSSGVASCSVNTPSMCNNSTPSPTGLTGGLAGFLVGPGYDEATGLGSIDVANLLAAWAGATTPLPATFTALTSSASTAALGTEVTLTATVTAATSALPVGMVTFVDGGTPLETAVLDASGGARYSTSSLAAGVHSIAAVYGGDVAHAGSTSNALSLGITLPVSVPPVFTAAGIVNAASSTTNIAPGSLATLYGSDLADNVYQGGQLLDANNHFVSSVAGIGVSVNGRNAPLIYVGPTQINFQVPWEAPLSPSVTVQVTRAGAQSSVARIAIASAASPSMFLNNYSTGVAWVTGTAAEGCATTQCAIQVGGTYQLWANGLGPKNQAEQDGVGDGATTLTGLTVVGGTASCQLRIGGMVAQVTYCGAAPGEIIDQLNFKYPSGVPAGAPVSAALTIGGATGTFLLPAPTP